MIEISTNQTKMSLGGIAAGFLATHLLAVDPGTDGQFLDVGPNIIHNINSSALSTYGLYSNIITGQTAFLLPQPESLLATFFVDLMSKQERLGPEFEQILFDNLWDLYAR